jgi:hypothetical protein
MDLIGVAAIVGAAAWLPQIGQWIYRYLTKPKVVLVPVRNFELGYSPFGPMLNLRASIGAERKDATITLTEVRLKHERGKLITLHWTSFTETFSQMRDKSGETTDIEREQPATAIRISTAFLTEKFIRFQDTQFQHEALKRIDDAQALRERVEKSSGAVGQAVVASREFDGLLEHYRHAFCWEAGRYDLEMELHLLGVSSPAVARLSFVLTPIMVDRLRENLQLVERGFRARFSDAEDDAAGSYYWANPTLDTSRLLTSAYLPSR